MAGLEWEPEAALATDLAAKRGASTHLIAGDAVTNKAAMLDAIAATLSFPDYFGRNLDALYDCLVDLSWLPAGEHVLIWSHPETLRVADPRGYTAITSVLADAVAADLDTNCTLRVVLTDI